ncbi:hypothetical protein KY363_06635 [Candidatus Woesearchaeota archaeon]|nr:hypothetical protein [Candidatus Woesearchaeota archaeon]
MKKTNMALGIVMVLIMAIGVSADSFTLWAGQNIDSGEVEVWNDGTTLFVKFTTHDGWELSQTHVDVASDLSGIPQTKSGNPKVGNFAYSMTHDPTVAEYTYEIDLASEGFAPGDDIVIAAHAVVVKEDLIEAAPYYAETVVEYSQGLTSDGQPVKASRSDPNQGLVFEAGQSESNFFSLGFGGYLIVGFDNPIVNGPGNDVKVIEDTWGTYPLEKAEVYASNDGISWTLLGIADNTNHQGIHTISEFDLGGMDEAMYIKLVDVSNPADFGSGADGYDVNAIEALHDRVDMQSETGWADGEGFPGKNWAMYIMYTIEDPEEPEDENMAGEFRTQTQGGWGSTANGNNPGAYRDENFDAAFPSGLMIGDNGGFYATFSTSAAIEAFLPQGGTAAAFDMNYADPVTTSAGVLAGQATALTLSVGFDNYDPDFGASATNLADLTVADMGSPFYGWTVQQVLDEANTVLAGLPSAYTPAQVNEALSSINENFVDGTIDDGFLEMP